MSTELLLITAVLLAF